MDERDDNGLHRCGCSRLAASSAGSMARATPRQLLANTAACGIPAAPSGIGCVPRSSALSQGSDIFNIEGAHYCFVTKIT